MMSWKIEVGESMLRSLSGSIFLNPTWITESRLRQRLKAIIGSLDIQSADKWLDVGCGVRPYETLFPPGTYTGVDVADSGRPQSLKAPDFFYDGQTLPFPDNSFDGALCTQVLEHVANPAALLDEIHRILKPGGRLVLSAPFLWEEHEEPYDFFRFSSFGIRELLRRCNFGEVVMQKTTGSLETLAQVMSVYVVTNLSLPIRGWGRGLSLIICCPIQVGGLLLQRLLPDQKRLFLDSVIVARRKA